MKIGQLVQAASTIGVALFMMAASVRATPIMITYDTDNTGIAGTGFNGSGSLVLNSISGDAATLTYSPNSGETAGVPSFIDLGHFILSCPACTSTSGATFSGFTFDLVIDDTTDGGTGVFVGTYTDVTTGSNVLSNVSDIAIIWQPLQLGPGTAGATSGSFGPTTYDTTNPTDIVDPTSGCSTGSCGRSSVQASIDSTSAVPEPATLSLIGGGLLGLGLVSRKRSARR